MKTNFKHFAVLSSLISIPLLLSSCGATPAAAPTPGVVPGAVATIGSTGCLAGQLPLPRGCTTVSDFSSACTFNGGQLVLGGPSATLCRLFFPILASWTPIINMPKLSPADPIGSIADDLGYRVYVNDKLQWSGSGGWGTPGFFSCNQKADLNGNDSNGIAVLNQTYPAGLYGTDGTEAFLMGTTLIKTITHNGELKTGFNAPALQSSCYTVTATSLTITRCFDSNGITYPCQ